MTVRDLPLVLLLLASAACERQRCLPSTCAGCCDPLDRCVYGDSARACGAFGTQCFLCSGGTGCTDGVCRDGGRPLTISDLGTAGGAGGGLAPITFGGGTAFGATCVLDRDCTTLGEVCHGVLKRCVQSCTFNSGCPRQASKCADTRGVPVSGTTRGYCQCASDAECSAARTGDVCQGSQACGQRCATSDDCFTGSQCDALNGRCNFASDAGSGCLFSGTRTSNAVCNLDVNCPNNRRYGLTCAGTSTCSCRDGASTRSVPASGVSCATFDPSTVFFTCSIPRP